MFMIPVLIIFLLSLAFINYFIELMHKMIKNEDHTVIRTKCMITFSLMVTSLAIFNLFLLIIYSKR
ncbi:MAG: hypothetical protein RIN55_12025 [Tissierellaceae bacterium]|nr:hypothetical protein [Tissierellaceae bacterium]